MTEVDPETAADMAGVSPGWTLSSINGLDVRKMPFWEVDARCCSRSGPSIAPPPPSP